jgi:hypothetical protein
MKGVVEIQFHTILARLKIAISLGAMRLLQ